MYQSYYNLTGKPFRLSPDPSFFFPSRGHKRALAYLRYGLHQNEGFVVITGAPGTGKTTLAQILLDELGEKNIVVAHLTTTQLEADDMLRMVAASFGLRYENLDKAALLKNIESFLLSRSREGKRALLVIDEAQNLPARSLEELRMLSNLQVGDKALLQTFLLGQVQFRNMLDNPDLEQLRQRVIANFHLSPLAADESQRYIESRLKHVDWNNDPHFAEIAFEKIHQYTEGVPRRINMFCDRILLFGCMEETHNITGELVDEVREELEQEVSSGTVNAVPSQDSALLSEPVAGTEPSYNAAASFNATRQLTEELKNVTKNRAPASADADSEEKSPVPETRQSKTKAGANEALDKIKTKPAASSGRIEPVMPGDIANEDEEFIDISKDFIDAFDKSVSLGDDDSAENEKSLINRKSSAKNRDIHQQAKAASQKPGEKQANKTNKKSKAHQNKKPVVKQQTESIESKDKPALANESERDPIDQDVLGNTVKHKQLAETEDESLTIDLTPEPPPQISERELFRVIPGGKTNEDSNRGKPSKQTPSVPVAPAAMGSPSSEDVVLRRILRLVLAFHRSPSSFPGLDDVIQPLPEGVSELLELAVSDDQVLTKVSPAAVMGISPVMLRAAVRFFVRRTLFAAKGDHYRTLGLQPNATVADIERHYDLLMRLLRQDKQAGAAESVDRVGRAYEELMRLDDVTADNSKTEDAPEEKAAQVLEALENPELTIDFSQEIKPEEKPLPVSAYLGAGGDNYTPDPRITRRRIHLLGQAAILGIGALVVVLGIFITQLEPTDNIASENVGTVPPSVANVTEVEPLVTTEERRRGLAFNDGSKGTDSESLSSTSLADASTTVDEIQNNKVEEKPVVSEKPAASKPVATKSKPKEPAPIVLPKPETKVAKAVPVQSFEPSASPGDSSKKSQAIEKQTSKDTQTKSVLAQAASVAVVAGAATKSSTATTSSSQTVSKFNSVPVEEKTAAVKQTPPVTTTTNVATSGTDTASVVSAESSASSSSAVPQNQFQGKDIPLSPSTIAVVPVTTKDSSEQGEPPTQVSGDSVKTAPVKIAKIEPFPLATQSISEITEPKLNQLLNDFSRAFEKGDLGNLMTFFTETARTSTQTTRDAIENEYKALFNASSTRSMKIASSSWDNEGQFARGVGEYSTTVTPQGGAPISVKGEYTMQLQLVDDKIRISRFYLSNEIPASSLKVAPVGPSSTELKALLSSFTEFYENGDIDRLMKLFADNAKTNDQTTLAGIRKDHEDLFNVTQARQMFLKDMKWNTKGDVAVGKGNFEVMVQNQGQSTFATVTGTVTVEATRTQGGVKITKFFHKSN